MATTLYNPNRSNWFNPNIQYLFDEEIIEYDIRDAGFSLIRQYKLLSPDKIQELAAMGKGEARHIAVGNLQKDKEFSQALLEKFAEVRALFINANNLTDDDIIAVKKDAIFVTGKCRRRTFGLVEFAQKSNYSSYVRLDHLRPAVEFYYSQSQIDVKGMGTMAVAKHRIYMLEFIRQMISDIETRNFHHLRRFVDTFVDQYKHGGLDETYYLEFNNLSKNPNPIYNYQQVIIPIIQIALREMD